MNIFVVSILVTLFFHHFAQAEVRSSVDVMGLSFISSDFNSEEKTNFGFIGASLISNPKQPEIFMINFQGFYAPGNAVLSYLNFREIYFTVPIDSYSQIHIGRKLKSWSNLDADWNIGFFQPQFRWNSLKPENQGLTGVFWDHDEATWGLSLMASPVYLPDQGPGYEVKDGQFQNSNPWFSAPPQSIRFQENLLPVDYNVRVPETTDVAFQSVYAGQLRFGEKTGWFANLSAAHKPANKLALGYTGVVVTTRVKIDVIPKTYYENNYAADLGIKEGWGSAQMSVLFSKPQQPKFENVANVPVFDDSMSFGPRFVYNLRPFQLGFAYLDTQGGDVKDEGVDASADRKSLSQRFLYRQAFQAQVQYSEIFMKKIKWDSSLQYTQSTKDPFKLVRFHTKLDIRGPWAFTSDVILVDTADDSNINMNAYRNLDQFWIGVSYDI